MSIKGGIFDIIGGTIKEIVVNESCSSPQYHLFIIFENGSGYEFYGNGDINSASEIRGGLEYAKLFTDCASIKRYYKNDKGQRIAEDISQNHQEGADRRQW